MASYYLVKIRIEGFDDLGVFKTKYESYLFDAISYTEAEAKGYENLIQLHPNFEVANITKMRLSDLFNNPTGDYWYKGKIALSSLDEKTGKEKRQFENLLVNAETFQEALERVLEGYKQLIVPYELVSLNLTPILEVFPYQSKEVYEDGETD